MAAGDQSGVRLSQGSFAFDLSPDWIESVHARRG